jgi:hypothetical protein
MSQNTARHDARARSEDDEDVVDPQARQPGHKHGVGPHQPVGQPADDDWVSPDEPGEGEFELAGDDDLGAADLGPAAPNFRDPDADSGRVRKISWESKGRRSSPA